MPELNSCWFAGPKAENAEWFTRLIDRVAWDYYFWRRNYFPGDGAPLHSSTQRQHEWFQDVLSDHLTELQGRLKGDYPFYSPRYAGHMLAEQTLPSIVGYFAAMLYNPNNVTSEAAPVTLQLEIEAAQKIATMLGHVNGGWSHLCSGGTAANIEALWVARSVLLLPHLVADVRVQLGLDPVVFARTPTDSLDAFARLFEEETSEDAVRKAMMNSYANPQSVGLPKALAICKVDPVLIVPESHHYCFNKAVDLLGIGQASIRRVKVDSDFRMDVDSLKEQIEEAEASGKSILAVVAVTGTTEEGAIDPLDQIVAFRDERVKQGKPGFWLHADGAYGGYLRCMMIPERIGLGQPVAKAILDGEEIDIELDLPENQACDALGALGKCDSITVDPHKLGYIPYPAGVISFKDARMKPLVRQVAPYLQDTATTFEQELTSEQVGMYSLEGSKPGATAASVWLSHKCIPLDTSGHGVIMRDTIRNACKLHALLKMDLGKRTQALALCPPGSNIVCYAFRPKENSTLREINELNRALYQRFSLGEGSASNVYAQSFYVSRTTLEPQQYASATVQQFLERLGVTTDEYECDGIFLLRSVLMNPWYDAYLQRGRDMLAELVVGLFEAADQLSGVTGARQAH